MQVLSTTNKYRNLIIKSCLKNRVYNGRLKLSTSTSTTTGSIIDDYCQVPHYSLKSSLYIRPVLKSDIHDSSLPTRIISPDLDMDHLFKVKNILKSPLSVNLTARHLNLNLTQLKDDYFKMKILLDKIDKFNQQKNEISEKIKELVKTKDGNKNKKQIMESDVAKQFINAGNQIKNEINQIMEELIPIEEFITIAFLRLPNDLHSSALFIYYSQLNKELEFDNDYTNELVLYNLNQSTSTFNQLQLNSNDWQTILSSSGADRNSLNDKWSFVDKLTHDSGINNNRYLIGSYAKLEQAVVDYIYDKLNYLNNYKNDSFEHIKSVSMFKSAIIEGCGENFNDPNQILNIVRFSTSSTTSTTHVDLHHLTGSASLSALILNFIRTQTNKKYLPWSLFTNGKNYSPKHGQINSFDLLTLCSDKSKLVIDNQQNIDDIKHFISDGQSYLNKITKELESFILNENLEDLIFSAGDSKKVDQIFIDHIKLFIYLFKDFKMVPMRFVCLNPSELKNNESFRIEIQSYLPSERNYVTIGKLSLLNDYVSKRLQVRLKKDEKNSNHHDHPAMIHTRIIDINLFVQCLIETHTTINNNSSNNKGQQYEFSLPEPLRKFYLK